MKETNRKKRSVCQIECCTEAREICLDLNELLFYCEHCATKLTLHPLALNLQKLWYLPQYPGPKAERTLLHTVPLIIIAT